MKAPSEFRWKQIRQLSAGGQANVFLVEPTIDDPEFRGQYALKELKRQDHPQAISRFVREIRATTQISHPGIVDIVDHSGERDDYHFYVMPYVDGAKTLDKVAFSESSPFKGNARSTLRFIMRCAEALGAAHVAKVVHRDINPKNILVLPNGEPLIIDFGCCYVDAGECVTLVDEGIGTRDYAAPECGPGAAENITVQTDIYSLGKIMWAMITGERAFARERPAFSNKRLDKVLPDCPEVWLLAELFKRTIRRDPKHRWAM